MFKLSESSSDKDQTKKAASRNIYKSFIQCHMWTHSRI